MAPSKNDNWIRRFTVSEPKRHKKGFTIYKVTSIVFPRLSPEAVTKVVVWKRYNDFKKLHQELKVKHQKLYLQDKFPAFAKATFFGRFEDDVIEERRKCAVALLEFIADHSPLFTSNVFVKFFESGYAIEDEEFDVPPVTQTLTFPNIDSGTSNTLEPIVVHPEVSQARNIAVTANQNESIVSKFPVEAEGPPLLKLGGTWQFPQQAESISLSSHSSEEGTIFTDTDSTSALSGSGVSSPLQSSDLQFFDPLQQSPIKQPSPNIQQGSEKILHSQVSNSWLLSLSPSSPDSSRSENEVLPPELKENISIPQQKDSTNEMNSKTSQEEVNTKPETSIISSHVTRDHETYPLPVPLPASKIEEPTSYIVEAAGHVGQAQQHEEKCDYSAAFALYKTGIACLLSGVQADPDNKRKQVVREKTARYLLQAEKIYNEHLSNKETEVSSFNQRKFSAQLQHSLSELQFYKVLGVINKAMLVLNTLEDKCYIMKVLHKSPCPVNDRKWSIIPQDVPYMVKLYQYFETDSAVYLVLQHASGGKLWDHVSSYFHSLPSTPVHEVTIGNVYLGKKLIEENMKEMKTSLNPVKQIDEDVFVRVDTDSVCSQDHSYLELIRDYTSTTAQKLFRFGGNWFNECPNNENTQVESNRQDCDGSSPVCNNEDESLKVEISDPQSIPLPDNVQSFAQENVNNSISNPVPDLVPQDSENLLSWKNLESLDTTDLVENAQKLLESVNKTLLKSENIASRLKAEQRTTNNMNNLKGHNITKKGSGLKSFVSSSSNVQVPKEDNGKTSSKTVVRCKSEDVPNSSTRRRERRLSSGRKRSNTLTRTSLERRYSSDDLFEGYGRTLCGSLDRAQQLSRLQSMIDRPKPRLPEANIRMWAAELVTAISTLHQWGIICRDLQPNNILLGEKGHLLLTYICQWADVDYFVSTDAVERLYAAPEVNGIFQLTPAVDWWSFGALIFELLTGKSLISCHPGGIHSHTILNIPEFVSEEAKSILNDLLRHNPQERLGSGVNGVQELKSHPFFNGIDWEMILATSFSS